MGIAYVTIVMKEISDRLDDGNEQPAMDRRSIAADVPVAPRAWAGLVVVANNRKEA